MKTIKYDENCTIRKKINYINKNLRVKKRKN